MFIAGLLFARQYDRLSVYIQISPHHQPTRLASHLRFMEHLGETEAWGLRTLTNLTQLLHSSVRLCILDMTLVRGAKW